MATPESISRKTFLQTLGLNGAALFAVLTSCKNSDETVTPTPTTSGIDLSTALLTVGSYVYNNGAIVARVGTGNTASSFIAVAQACTHEGTSVQYLSSGKLRCPNHGAEFTTAGVVTQGPATKNLKVYTVTITGNSLKVA